VLVFAVTGLISAPAVRARAASPRPNVVVIVTDDQRWDSLGVMPIVQRELVGRGVTFTNAFVSNPLCCPSRASILTGDYSHTTGVYRQIPPFGRFEAFHDGSTLATWLDGAGYDTALVGKYIDGYQHAGLTGYIPPGWDRWVGFIHAGYLDYQLSIDGEVQAFGEAPGEYSTDVLAGEAVRFIRGAQGPLFLYFAPEAPHAPAIPAVQDRLAFTGDPVPMAPSFDEADVSDKPAYVRDLPRLNEARRAEVVAFARDQDRTLLAVDRAVGQIVEALRATGRLQDTLIVFTSDNGISYGEHRWTKKEVPYEESIRVPMVVRFDPAGVTKPDDHIVAKIDIAPTIAALAGVATPAVDGRSLLPLLGPPGSDPPWRQDLLLEHMEGTNPVPTYCGVRAVHSVYVRYATGEEELYDLVGDPFELHNLAADPSAAGLLSSMRARLDSLCDPPPPGFDDRWSGRIWLTLGVLLASFALEAIRIRRRRRVATVHF
jgi:N-acetylglucosamine-6-sulfatase